MKFSSFGRLILCHGLAKTRDEPARQELSRRFASLVGGSLDLRDDLNWVCIVAVRNFGMLLQVHQE